MPLLWLAVLEADNALMLAYHALARGEPIGFGFSVLDGIGSRWNVPAIGSLGWRVADAAPFLDPGAFAGGAGFLAIPCAWWCLARARPGAPAGEQRLRTRLVLVGVLVALSAILMRAQLQSLGRHLWLVAGVFPRLAVGATLGSVLLHDAFGEMGRSRVTLARLATAHFVVLLAANAGALLFWNGVVWRSIPDLWFLVGTIAATTGAIAAPPVLAWAIEPSAPRAWMREWPRPLAALGGGVLGCTALLIANRGLPHRMRTAGGMTWVNPDAILVQFGLLWLMVRLSAGVLRTLIVAGQRGPAPDDPAADAVPVSA